MTLQFRSIIAGTLLGLLAFAAPALAEQPERADRWAVEGGMGFMLDPDLFSTTTALAYGVRDNLQLVTTIQWAFDSDSTVIAPTAALRYLIPLGRNGSSARQQGQDGYGSLSRWAPFIHAGLGFAYLDTSGTDSTEFLLEFGFGADYTINDDWSLVTAMRFNTLPGEDDWFYSWQVVGAQYRF